MDVGLMELLYKFILEFYYVKFCLVISLSLFGLLRMIREFNLDQEEKPKQWIMPKETITLEIMPDKMIPDKLILDKLIKEAMDRKIIIQEKMVQKREHHSLKCS
jgi:hypothetical protein